MTNPDVFKIRAKCHTAGCDFETNWVTTNITAYPNTNLAFASAKANTHSRFNPEHIVHIETKGMEE